MSDIYGLRVLLLGDWDYCRVVHSFRNSPMDNGKSEMNSTKLGLILYLIGNLFFLVGTIIFLAKEFRR